MNVTVQGRSRHFRTVSYDAATNSVLLIEQRLIPHQFEIFASRTFRETAAAIKDMIVRGAGAIGATAFGGLGLLTASRAQKIESVSGLINLVMMPMWIFSGVFFSYERFPAAVQPFIRLLPLTALNDALRATILEGTPLLHQPARLLVLLVWGGVSFALAVRWFRWT